MNKLCPLSNCRLILWTVVLILLSTQIFRAELLPIKTYFSTDGLVYDKVYRTFQDSHGFVWFFTPIGVSRFDGYQFVNYSLEHGLENSSLFTDAVEDENGVYWFASIPGGVYRFDPRPKTSSTEQTIQNNFELIPVSENPASNQIRRIYRTKKNEIFVGTLAGVYQLVKDEKRFTPFILNPAAATDKAIVAQTFDEDEEGSFWIGHDYGLTRRLPSGKLVNYEITLQEKRIDRVLSLTVDTQNRVWLVTDVGRKVIVFNPEPAAQIESENISKRKINFAESQSSPNPDKGFAHLFPASETLAQEKTFSIDATKDGSVWLSVFGVGLVEYNGRSFRLYTTANGLSDTTVRNVTEDNFGNLWIASDWGAMRWNRNNFVTYHVGDGLGNERICGIIEDRNGALYVTTPNWTINRLQSELFTNIKLNLPPVNNYVADRVISDSAGDWWFATGAGLYRFTNIERMEDLQNAAPQHIFSVSEDQLPDNQMRMVQEDSSHNIWFSYENKPGFLTRWHRQSGQLQTFTVADGIPQNCIAQTMREDASGNIYFQCFSENILIFRNERFKTFTHESFDKKYWISDIIIDRQNTLWAATPTKGLLKVENILSDNPNARLYSTKEGISSLSGQFLVEDNAGLIYYLNARALDVLNPQTEQVKKYTLADGLNGTGNGMALRDSRGNLWFGTHRGVSRLDPQMERRESSLPVFIGKIRIAGESQPISAIGEKEISDLALDYDRRQIEIDFFGLSLATGESLRYQYKLEGADFDDWSEPSERRTVPFTNIAPGSYRFLVRAVNSDGITSSQPAVVSFTVLPPIWLRWWFLLSAVSIIAFAVYAFYRYRIRQIIKLERVRTRIATDLHDDIGSSLSQIAILSEVVRQKVLDNETNKPLDLIAETSREMVDSMSDIVWAINPNKDSLSDLTKRMRRFATDTLEAKDIALTFVLPESSQDVALGTDIRREVYLMFKECVNNLAKHAEATEANIIVANEKNRLFIKIDDNGKGFRVPSFDIHMTHEGFGGNGLLNLKKRAEKLGGKFQIISEIGKGTETLLEIPIPDKKWITF